MKGFWSYVRLDDEAEQGRISQLARDVVAEFEMISGEKVDLFLDRDDIEWGDNWRSTVDANLAATAFFVAVVTPRYFDSPECRREASGFLAKATSLGVTELFLPILYIDAALIRDQSTSDELVRTVRPYQWEDWTTIRFADRNTQAYREAVHRLAERLRLANETADATPAVIPEDAEPTGLAAEPAGAPGILDKLAIAEESLPKWNANLESMTTNINAIGEIMSRGSKEMQARASEGFAGRAKIVRRVASQLTPHAEEINSQSNEFVALLHDVDEGYRTIINMAPAAMENAANAEAFCSVFQSIRNLAKAADTSLDSTQGMINSFQPLEEMSRDLRPPLKLMREGLTRLVEARAIMSDWVAMMDASAVECEHPTNGQ